VTLTPRGHQCHRIFGCFLRKSSVHPISNSAYIISPINIKIYTLNYTAHPENAKRLRDTAGFVRTSTDIPALVKVKVPCSVKKLFPILGSCGSNSAVFHVRKTASPLMRARFQRAVPNLPRAFFLLFAECVAFTHFFFFLSRKKEEKREIYIKRNLIEKL